MPSSTRAASIACVAAQAGLSREGFTRRFSRHHGMPPHAYRRMLRLNNARQMLRTGTPPAEVAAATDFADQSHFGPWFRHAFGTTPSGLPPFGGPGSKLVHCRSRDDGGVGDRR
nr:helix-turn-helix domain-containing protein [Methylobacterium sp. WL12]